MEDLIIRLRKFSLRWTIVIMFATTIYSGFSSLKSGGSLMITSLILFIGSTLFYAVWCAQAIKYVKKALLPVCVIICATLINLIGQWSTLNESIDFEGAITDAIWGDDTVSNNLIYTRAMASYPTQLLLSLVSGAIFIYVFRYVDKKYRFCWAGMAFLFILNFINLLMLVTEYNGYQSLNIYIDINNIIGWLSAIVFIVLLYQGNNKHLEATEISNDSSGNTFHSQSTTTKSESLPIEEKSQLLFKLKELLDSGVLSKEEFESEKTKILNK